jgi:hypothetical protein
MASRTDDDISDLAPDLARGSNERQEALLEAILRTVTKLESDMAGLQRAVAVLTDNSQRLFLPSGASSAAKEIAGADSRIAHHIHAANAIFRAEYVSAAASSVIPAFMAKHCKNKDLSADESAVHRALFSLMFSLQPNEKRSASTSDVGRVHSDLKLLIAKVLMRDAKSRTSAGMSQGTRVERHSSSQDAGVSQSDTISPCRSEIAAGGMPQPEWMSEGYIRREIYDEIRTDKDGAENEATESRSKKRRVAADAESRDEVSRAILRALYQKIHTFMRAARDQSRRIFTQQLGYIMRAEATAEVHFPNAALPSLMIQDIPQTHPLAGAAPGPLDRERNQSTLDALYEEHTEMKARVRYSVSVKDASGSASRRELCKEVNVLKCALNFSIAFSQTSDTPKFLRSSPDALRMVYLVAVAFRNLLVRYEKLRSRRDIEVVGSEPGAEWSALRTCWEQLMPGDIVQKRLLDDGILQMSAKRYRELVPPDLDRSLARGPGSRSQDDDLDDDDESLMLEVRMH